MATTKTVKCQFGRDAENGDYVLTLHQYGYKGKDSIVLAGMVWDGKVYTGWRPHDGNPQKTDVHKLNAILVIDGNILTDEQKQNIQADMAECLPGFAEPPKTLKRYLERTKLEHIKQVWAAFELCKNEDDLDELCDRLKYAYGGKFGEFEYTINEDGVGFTVLNSWTNSQAEYEEEENEFDFYGIE